MTAIADLEALLRQPAAQAIGWALLQFLWQGALIGVLTAAALAALRRSAADVRYVVATIGLLLMLTMPVVTAVQMWRASVPAAPERAAAAVPLRETRSTVPVFIVPAPDRETAGGVATAAVYTAPPSPATANMDRWVAALLMIWLAGVAVLSLRLVSGWLWVQRMKSHGTSPLTKHWEQVGAKLCRRLHIARTVRLLQSVAVDVPTVIGWLRPVVLLPASALAGLAPHQLEAILAHELAHIRRHDYLVNLLQTLVETLLFYHPAVWWVSGRIRIEREHCCDDLAVSLCGDPYAYASALAELEECRGAERLVLAATGGSLLDRVRRLLGASSHAGRGPGWLAGTTAALILAGIAAGAIGQDLIAEKRAQGAPASPEAVKPKPAQPARPESRTERTEPVIAIAGAAREVAAHARAAERRAREMAMAAHEFADAAQAAIAGNRPAIEAAAALLAEHQPAIVAAADALAEVGRTGRTAEAALEAVGRAIEESSRAALAGAAAVSSSLAAATLGIGQSDSHGHFTWSNGREKLEVRYRGAIEFSDDDTDVKSLSPGGSLRIKEGGWSGTRTVEFTADASGTISRRYWVGTSERPFEPEGRQWVAQSLPKFIRQTGIGAPARVARILRAKGPAGVLAEISLIQGSWAKRLYFNELLKSDKIDARTAAQIFEQAGREIDSDFELASLLIGAGERLPSDDATRRAYFDAARSIQSDFETKRVYSSALKRGSLSPDLLAAVLEASASIESDFEAASLLIQVAKLQQLDARTRPAFFKALQNVDSDFEHRRVLSALAERTDLDAETVAAMLDSAVGVGSDHELATFLTGITKTRSIEGGLRAPFFRAADGLSSSFERGRVLKAVIGRTDASTETVAAVLRALRTMDSSHETSQVLQAVASRHTLSGETRDLYIDAAERLGDFEQSRALAALVKSERRK